MMVLEWLKEQLRMIATYKDMIIVLVIVVIASLLSMRYLPAEYLPFCMTGLISIAGITITALLALHRYHIEQRTIKLQKIYFENALLGQAKSMEKMMSKSTSNFLGMETLFILLAELITRQRANIDNIRDDLNIIFDTAIKNIDFDINTDDFKKETISILLKDSHINENNLPTWIKRFQDDAYRFSYLLKNLLIILKHESARLNTNNHEAYISNLQQTLNHRLQNNYIVIKRHYILFSLFSEIVLDFSSENYASIQTLRAAFKKHKIQKIIRLINECYKELITDFIDVDIDTISSEQAIRIEERIKCAGKKIIEL